MEKIDWGFLVAELKKGNNEVLGVFYEQHSSYCNRRLLKENKCTQEDAEDIFIESIMNLREKLISGREVAILNVRAYLYRTCHNMFLYRLKKSERLQHHHSEIERFYYDSNYLQSEDGPFDPKLIAITNKAWEILSERCKDILYFFYVDKLGMKEIARLMDLSTSDVAKTTKSRCYKKLVDFAIELQNTEEKSMTE